MLSDDLLPQPYRLINKIVQEITSNALDEIGKRLLRGCVVDKQYLPPHTLPLVSFPLENILADDANRLPVDLSETNAENGSSKATVVAAAQTHREVVAALSDGHIVIRTADEDDDKLLTRKPVIPTDMGITVAIDAIASSGGAECLYAVATTSSITVFSVSDTASVVAETPLTSVDGHLLVDHVALCVVDESKRGDIASIRLSPDSRFLAVVFHSKDVRVYEILLSDATGSALYSHEARLITSVPPPPAACGTSSSTTSDGEANPSNVAIASLGAVSVGFFCIDHAPAALGYYQPHHMQQQLFTKSEKQAASLLIAWQGSTTVVRVPLREFSTNAKQRVSDAKLALGQALVAQQQQSSQTRSDAGGAATGTAAGGAPAKGKAAAQKGAAAVSPAADPPGGPAAGATGPEMIAAMQAAVDSSGISFFGGTRELTLPRPVYCLAWNAANTMCAIGLSDGMVLIHDGRSVVSTLQSAKHRLTQFSVNSMYPVSMVFQCGHGSTADAGYLIVGFAVNGISHRCFVDVFDLSRGPSLSPLVPMCSPQEQQATPSGTTASMPAQCISRLRYVDGLLTVIPVAHFPMYVVVTRPTHTAPLGQAFLVDSTNAETLGRIDVSTHAALQQIVSHLSAVSATPALPAASSPQVHRAQMAPLILAASLRHSASSQALVSGVNGPSLDTSTFLMSHTTQPPSGSKSCSTSASSPIAALRLHGAAVVAGVYHSVAQFIGSSPVSLPRATTSAISKFMMDVRHHQRDATALERLPQYLSQAVLADELRQSGGGASRLRMLTQALSRGAAGGTTGGAVGASAVTPALSASRGATKAGTLHGRLSTSLGSTQRSAAAAPLATTTSKSVHTLSSATAAALLSAESNGGSGSLEWESRVKQHLQQREESRASRQERLKLFLNAPK